MLSAWTGSKSVNVCKISRSNGRPNVGIEIPSAMKAHITATFICSTNHSKENIKIILQSNQLIKEERIKFNYPTHPRFIDKESEGSLLALSLSRRSAGGFLLWIIEGIRSSLASFDEIREDIDESGFVFGNFCYWMCAGMLLFLT